MTFSRENSEDIMSMKWKLVASQKKHSEKKQGLLEIKYLEQKCESSIQGIKVKETF